MLNVEYILNERISVADFICILQESGLSARRPIIDTDCLQGMLNHTNLMVSARQNDRLIGISRCLTDFHYACYCADLAVAVAFQKQGIGKKLMQETQNQLGPNCSIILLSAPNAVLYYPHIGFTQHQSAWTLAPSALLAC